MALIISPSGTGTVTGVTGTAPVVSSGGTAPAISMAAATTSVPGYLTAADWNTFNGKQAAGTYLSSSNYTSYSPSLTGGSASGTWGINVTGTAASETLATVTGRGASTATQSTFSGMLNVGTSGTDHGLRIYAPSGDATGAKLQFTNFAQNVEWSHIVGTLNVVTVTASTGLTCTGNVTAYSDERLKKDWTKLPANFIEQLSKVKSGTYTRIDNNTRQAGSSAQDWQALLPEVVMVATDEEQTLSLAYGNAALVSAVELAKEVVSLTTRIARLEALVSKLIEG